MAWLAYSIVWIVVGACVIYTLYLTKNLNSLWFLILPLFVSIESKKLKNDKDSQ